MNQRDKETERFNSELYLNFVSNSGVKIELLSFIDKRVYNNYTQKDVAKLFNRSLATIKRFENGQVDSLSLFFKYKDKFEPMRNRKSRVVPKWL